MKSILLITVPMDGYETELINSLESNGYIVKLFKEGSKIQRREFSRTQLLLKLLSSLIPIPFITKKFNSIEKSIYQNKIASLSDKYDYVFDFAGKSKANCLELLRHKYNATFILYLWDDVSHNNSFITTRHYFDKIFTFSKNDAKIHGLQYRPNFFTNDYLYSNEDKSIDVFYKGTARDIKRSVILQKIINSLPQFTLDVSLFVNGGFLKNYSKIVSKDFFVKYCNSVRLNNQQMADKSKRAKAILDIAYDNQNGIGLRPIQAIASNCKIITNNENIFDYDIYHVNNVFYIKNDMSNLNDLQKFMNLSYVKKSPEEIYRYSVQGFIDEIFQ